LVNVTQLESLTLAGSAAPGASVTLAPLELLAGDRQGAILTLRAFLNEVDAQMGKSLEPQQRRRQPTR